MVSQKYHTPLCVKNCKIEHHDLVTVLCLDSSQKSDELPDLLRECIDSYQNWDHNSEVPDPLEDLRCPLIYLASAFGKAGLVRALLQDNFDARALNFNGETALHGAVQYIFRTGTLKTRGFKVASTLGPIKNRMKAFERILAALTDSDPKIMFIQDNNGNTVFHAAAENIWNDRQNDRLGKSAGFFQFCLKSMITRALDLEGDRKITREEIIEALNAENGDGDTIFHILARDYAFGFKSMKLVLKKFFPGQVPPKANKENETVVNIALRRNRKRALQVFPEFLEHSDISISVSSDSDASQTESPSPSPSKEAKEFSTLGETTAHHEIPWNVISNADMPQVTHLMEEEENSSSELIANSIETVSGPSDQEVNTAPLLTNPGIHDLLTVSIDNTLGKPSQMEVPSFLSLSQKPNAAVSPYDSLVNAPVEAEVMYVSDAVHCNDPVVSKEANSSDNSSKTKELPSSASQHPEVLDTANVVAANDQSDPIAPSSITYSSTDSDAMAATSSQASAPPSEERVAVSSEESASLEEEEAAITDSIEISPETEVPANYETPTELFDTSIDHTVESCDAQVPISNVVSFDAHKTQSITDSQVPTTGERGNGIPDNISAFEVPQTNQPQQGEDVDSSQRDKGISGTIPSELFDLPTKQIPEPAGEYEQFYDCRVIDTPSLASQHQSKDDNIREVPSLTSLTSASTESIHSESFDSLDVTPGGSDERNTILKCITDNSFLEFLITEGLELDSRSKKGVVDVVMAQYNNKLSNVENAVPKLAAQIRKTEKTIDQQTEKVKQLQEELEFVKGEIVKNRNLLQGYMNEQQGLGKQRKALKRKVARCEGTMKHLLGTAKKIRLE